MRDAAYAGAVTIATAVTTTRLDHVPSGPAIYDLGGVHVPVVPALIGIFAALLVRIIVITGDERRTAHLRTYNVSVTLLAMLGAATYITDQQLGPGASFMTGLGCGAVGVGMIEVARSQFFGAVTEGVKTAFAAMTRGKPGGSDGPP